MNNYSLNIHGQLLDLSTPKVMGILNVTPDSFYTESRKQTEMEIRQRCRQIIEEGANIIDIGAYSSRPNAAHIDEEEEIKRLRTGLQIIREEFPNAIISVDTFRANVAAKCIEEYGVGIINDISAGNMDKDMFNTVARLQVPYIMMHMKGTPQTMQQAPQYDNVIKEIFIYFAERIHRLHDMGINDLILDPGFGFGKTMEHNYTIMKYLEEFTHTFNLPLLVGISRKSMIYKLLGGSPADSLNGTSILNTIALLKGTHILRVHDVKEAIEAIRIVETIRNAYHK